MLATAMAKAPAASSVSPRWPRNNMEMMDRVYRIKDVRAIGDESLNNALVSWMTCEGVGIWRHSRVLVI